MRHPENFARPGPERTAVAEIVEDIFHVTVDLHLLNEFRMHNRPRVAENIPMIRVLDLVTVDNLLLEQTELVIDAIAERRIIQRRQ